MTVEGFLRSTAAAALLAATYAVASADPVILTASAFLDRFTAAEKLATQQAMLDHPLLGAAIRRGLGTGHVDLNDAGLRMVMNGLVRLGILSAAREAAIMAP